MKVPPWIHLAAAFATLNSLPAATLAITGATFQNIADETIVSTGEGSFSGPSNVISLTTSEGTFGGLTGVISNDLPNFTVDNGTPERFYFGTPGAENYAATGPVTSESALTGLRADDGLLNIGLVSNFQLGGGFTENTRIFLIDLNLTTAGLDNFGIQLIDSGNNLVGTTPYTLNIAAANFGGPIMTYADGTGLRSNSFAAIANLGLFGVSFALSDFVGTGDLSTATGIRLTGTGGIGGPGAVDPSVIGTYVVPEPSTCLLVISSLAFGMAFVRRRHLLRA